MTAFEATRSVPLQQQIADHLARRIVTGELPDKSRLPSTLQLAAFYQVTPVTIHKSLQTLVQRQLIERHPRRGTFVRSKERVNVIALVFGNNPFRSQSPLYSLLLDEFQKQAWEQDFNLKVYLDFDSGSRTLYDLEQDIAGGEVKAVISCNRTEALTAFIAERPGVLSCEPVHIDFQHSIRTGVEYLIGRGYRRITVVSMLPEELRYANFREQFECERRGMLDAIAGSDAKAEIIRWGSRDIDGYEKGKALLAAPRKRPDAILVHHDVLCRGLLIAILEAGLKIPRDIAVVTHHNKGCDFASPIQLTALEVVDPEQIARATLATLAAALQEGKAGHIEIPQSQVRLVPGKSCGE